jgi:hypothetical protein
MFPREPAFEVYGICHVSAGNVLAFAMFAREMCWHREWTHPFLHLFGIRPSIPFVPDMLADCSNNTGLIACFIDAFGSVAGGACITLRVHEIQDGSPQS